MKATLKSVIAGVVIAGALTLAGSADAASLQVKHRGIWFGDIFMLNPQPLPPKMNKARRTFLRGEWVALNPQPLPPRWRAFWDEVLLNPQPLPPLPPPPELFRRR
jgi:hypothetical protein